MNVRYKLIDINEYSNVNQKLSLVHGNTSFIRTANMKPHWVVEYISFVCRHCKAPFEKALDLVEHKKLKHPQELVYYPLPPSLEDKKSSSNGKPRTNSTSRTMVSGAAKEPQPKNVPQQVSQKRIVYLCQHCRQKLPSFDDLLEHKLALHPELTPYLGDYSCQMCLSRYTDRRNYEQHMLNHKTKLRTNADYPCNACGLRFLTEGALQSHADQNHGAVNYTDVSDYKSSSSDLVCRFCKKTLPHNFALRQHLRRVHGSEVVEDKAGNEDYEQDDFQAPDDLSDSAEGEDFEGVVPESNQDLITDTQGGRLSCSFCARQLRSVSELMEHERIHTGERPFLCRLCGKGFARARALSAHQRDHTLGDIDGEEEQEAYPPPTIANQPQSKPKPAVPPLLAIKNMPQLKLQHNVLAQQAVKKLSDRLQSTGPGNGIRNGRFPLTSATNGTYACPYCKTLCADEHLLKVHIETHTEDKTYECDLCHEVFGRSRDLALHEQRVHGRLGPKSHRTWTVTKGTSGSSAEDSDNDDSEEPFVPDVIIGSSKLSSHSAMSSQDVEVSSQMGPHGQSESFKKLLAQHRRRKIYCKLCNKDFPTFEMLFNHRKFKHPHLMRKAGEYRCNLCHTVNTDRDTFNRHVKAHEARMEQGTDFPCELCDKRFLSQPKLDMHLTEHHPDAIEDEDEPSDSEFALQEFQRNEEIKQSHQLSDGQSHPEKKPRTERRLIQCQFCDYVARGNQAWKEHERLHTGERPYPCRICGKRFNRLRNRRSHERGVHRLGKLPQGSSRRESMEGITDGDENDFSHEGQSSAGDQEDSSLPQSQQVKSPPYRCAFCNFGFRTINALLQHIKRCTSVSRSRSTANQRLQQVSKNKKLHGCSHCNQGFTSRGALFYHKAKAHRDHRMQCPQCDASYVLESQLRTHLKTKHGLEVDDDESMGYNNSEENEDMISPETFVQVSLDPLAYLDEGNSQSISPQSQDEEPMEYESEEASRAAAFFGVLNLKPRKSFADTLAVKDESS